MTYEFSTESGSKYLYDSSTNCIHTKIKKAYYPPLHGHKKTSITTPPVRPYFPSETQFFDDHCNLNHIILGITEECNFRCKYCAYSGQYQYNRSHSNQSMSYDIAQKSIEYYLKLLSSSRRVNISQSPILSFYGGEPLLNIDLIKSLVKTIKKKHSALYSKIQLQLTTNGYMLNNQTSKWLIDNNFKLAISLDGPQKAHDTNRVTQSNQPTFNKIIHNLHKIKSDAPDFYKKNISFLAVYGPNTDLAGVVDFFSNPDELIQKKIERIDRVNSLFGLDKNLTETGIADKQLKILAERYKQLALDAHNDHPLFFVLTKLFGQSFYLLNSRKITIPEKSYYPKSTCIPGNPKLYIDATGNLYPCERVNEHLTIGHIAEGVNYSLAKDLFEKFHNAVLTDCPNCLARHFCPFCYANTGKISDFTNNNQCKSIEEGFKGILKAFCEIKEQNPNAFAVED